MFIKHKNSKSIFGGFTLIELLVVVAIIGILSGVVIASLNAARTKGKIANIKSNLRSMIAQAELSYDTSGNYSTVCTDAVIVKIKDAITNAGATSGCYVYPYDYSRWGVSAKLNLDATKNYTVDQNGVAVWDTVDLNSSNLPGGNTKNWDEATAACAAVGGRLPSIEQLKALSLAYGSTTPTEAGFIANSYWTSTTRQATPTNAYSINMPDGVVNYYGKTGHYDYVRCIH